MVWTDPVAFHDGPPGLTAAEMNTYVAENLKTIGDPRSSYTPTLTGISLGGGGTSVGKFSKSGRAVNGTVVITLGTTGALSGTPGFTLPAAPLIVDNGFPFGICSLFDASATAFVHGFLRWNSTASNVAMVYNNATPTSSAVVNASTPWTWTSGDKILAQFSYEAAA